MSLRPGLLCGRLSRFLKHPLILLMIGSGMTYWLIPWILSDVAKKESDRKGKVALAVKYLDQNSEMNQRFNSLLVSLELFHKYSSAKHLSDEQRELRKNSTELYMKFDRDVWWWPWNLYEEAKKFIPQSEDPYVRKALNRYTASWSIVLDKKLPDFWYACLNANYRIHDATVTKLMEETRKAFDTSCAIRDTAIRSIVSELNVEQASASNQ